MSLAVASTFDIAAMLIMAILPSGFTSPIFGLNSLNRPGQTRPFRASRGCLFCSTPVLLQAFASRRRKPVSAR